MTTDAEAQRLEDRIRDIAEAADRRRAATTERKLRDVDEDLLATTVPFDEWEILYRQRLQLERELSGDGRAIGEHVPEGSQATGDHGPQGRPEEPPAVAAAKSLGAVALLALAADRLVRRRASAGDKPRDRTPV
jgi:hypothetical protein